MPSRFMVSLAARAVGMTSASLRPRSHQHVGGDGLDFRHDQVRFFLLDQSAQRGAIGHRDDVGAMGDLMAGAFS
jgi:hypothetical protein